MNAFRYLLASSVLGPGCAAVPATAYIGGVEQPRQTLHFRGGPYGITHRGAHPAPGGPSAGLRDEGGVISGRVCGQDVSYRVRHLGDHVELDGWVASGLRSHIEVRDRGWKRLLLGNVGAWSVDLGFSQEVLYGRLGPWTFILGSIGDHLAENVFFPGMTSTSDDRHRSPVGLYGRRALWEMPPADQAAVLPLVLSCMQTELMLQEDHAGVAMGFGVPGEEAPLPVRALLAVALPQEAQTQDARSVGDKSYQHRLQEFMRAESERKTDHP